MKKTATPVLSTTTIRGTKKGENNELREDTNPEKKLNFDDDDTERKVIVSVSSNKLKSVTGEVDMDLSCLIFDESGNYRETIFWDNLRTKGIEHKGDEKLDDEEEEDSGDEKNPKKPATAADLLSTENIEVNEITHLVFVLNIFNNKTFAALSKMTFTVISKRHKDKDTFLARYVVPSDKIKKMRDSNALIMAKLVKKNTDWFARVISVPHTIPLGQVVDVLIPAILRDRHDQKIAQIVEPSVATWSKIVIQVIAGKALISADLNGRSDPYVKVICGTFKRRTTVSKANLNPKWDQEEPFELSYDDSAGVREITFIVKDRDRIGKNDFLGQFVVTIAKIPLNKEINRWFRLQPAPHTGPTTPNSNQNTPSSSSSPSTSSTLLGGSYTSSLNLSAPEKTQPDQKPKPPPVKKIDKVYGSINIKLHKIAAPSDLKKRKDSSSIL